VLSADPQYFYDRTTLERALDHVAFHQFGQEKPLPKNSGDGIKFSRFDSMPEGVLLAEGYNPSPVQLAKTTATISVDYLGNYAEITEEVDMKNPDATLTEAAVLNGENAAQTLDIYYRDKIAAGTNVRYGNGVSTRVGIVTKVAANDLNTTIRALQTNKAKMFTEINRANTGVGTTPIRASYFAVTDFWVAHDLESITGFIPVAEYPDPSIALPNELGSYRHIRFIGTTNSKVYADLGGAASTTWKYTTADSALDVHTITVFGMNGYGVTPLEAIKNIIKPKEVAGGPLERFATSGWKASTGCGILTDNWIYRIEVAVTV